MDYLKKHIGFFLLTMILLAAGSVHTQAAVPKDYKSNAKVYAVYKGNLNSTVHTSVNSAAKALRNSLKNRSKTSLVNIAIKEKDIYKIDTRHFYAAQNLLAMRLRDFANEHTGNPYEGDYLYWDQVGDKRYDVVNSTKIGDTVYAQLKFTTVYETTKAQQAALEKQVKSIIKSFKFTKKTSDYAKAKTIYAWVCNNISYDKIIGSHSYSAYNALRRKKGVCEAYSELIYIMFNSVGIDCRIIVGGGHAWNIAKIGKKYYNLDATFDDKRTERNWRYFLVGNTTQFLKDHNARADFLTESFTKAYPIRRQ